MSDVIPMVPETAPVILSEGNGSISREAITVASGAGVVESGTVLGKVTASGKYLPRAPGATDGSEVAAAILRSRVDATSADAKGVGIVRLAEISEAALVWEATNDGAAQTAALAELATLNMIARS